MVNPDLPLQRVLDRFELVSGLGEPREGTACVMSLVAYLAGEDHTAHPGCASPLIRAFAIPVNDGMPREARRRLKPFAPRLIGTNDGFDPARAEILRRVLVEVILPKACGEHQAAHPSGGPARRRAGPFGRLWVRLLRGDLLRRISRLLDGAEMDGGWRCQGTELSGAAGDLVALCARDARDAGEAEWYWNQAIGLLDRLCEVGAQARQGARTGAPGAAGGGSPTARPDAGRDPGPPLAPSRRVAVVHS